MNKKGFTLVELLAVIVILAIIAVIATPIILGVIDKAKKGAAEQSALGYIDAVEKQIAIDQMDTTNISIWKNGTYTKLNEEPLLRVKVKGTVPNGVSVTITNKKVKSAILTVGDYSVKVDDTGKVTTTKTGATDEKPDDSTVSGPTMTIASKTDTYKGIIYLDPTDLSKTCNASNSVSATGTKEGCMKWYIFDDSGNNYTMILDHNTTAKVEWNSEDSNSEMNEIQVELDNLQ